MYKQLSDVPAAIRSFYHEEIRNEQVFNEDGSPVLVDKDYTYQDENGDEQTGTRPEPVFQDNTYVVENAPGEFKAIDDVWRVAGKHRGHRDDIIELFVGMVGNAEQYAWFDRYKAWLSACDVVNAANENKVADSDGVTPDDIPLPDEPVKPAVIDVNQWKLGNYERLRKYAMPDKTEQMNLMYADMLNGTTKFRERVEAINAQYPEQ